MTERRDPDEHRAELEDALLVLAGESATPRLVALERDDPRRFAACMDEARGLLDALAEARLEALPAAATRRALDLLRGPGAVERLRAAWRTLVARPVGPEAAPAVRAGGPSPGSPSLHSAEGYDVDVAPAPGGGLVGQVLPTTDPPAPLPRRCTVSAVRGSAVAGADPGGGASAERLPVTVDVEASGEFTVPGPLPRRVSLILEVEAGTTAPGAPGLRIVVEDVALW